MAGPRPLQAMSWYAMASVSKRIVPSIHNIAANATASGIRIRGWVCTAWSTGAGSPSSGVGRRPSLAASSGSAYWPTGLGDPTRTTIMMLPAGVDVKAGWGEFMAITAVGQVKLWSETEVSPGPCAWSAGMPAQGASRASLLPSTSLCPACAASVSYTHLTLPTKRIV